MKAEWQWHTASMQVHIKRQFVLLFQIFLFVVRDDQDMQCSVNKPFLSLGSTLHLNERCCHAP